MRGCLKKYKIMKRIKNIVVNIFLIFIFLLIPLLLTYYHLHYYHISYWILTLIGSASGVIVFHRITN